MLAVENFKTVIERRKGQLSPDLWQRNVFDDLFPMNNLSKVCEQLNSESCLKRNWERLAIYLIKPSPDILTIDRIAKCDDRAVEILFEWHETDAEGSFDKLLQAMIHCRLYSAADELLNYLESVDQDDKTSLCEPIEENIPVIVDEPTPATSSQQQNTGKHEFSRSTSCPKPKSKFIVKLINCFKTRSKSWPPDSILDNIPPVPIPPVPEIKKNGIFIVSSNEDSETPSMKQLLSCVLRLKKRKMREWRVSTIHDLPGGPTATNWLMDQVDTAVYVLICFSERMKQVYGNSKEFAGQSECNLKFTLEFLITGKLYHNMCYNYGGKFLPILLSGNDASCMSIMQSLALFKTYNWPNEQKSIEKYLLNLPERTPPPLGERIPIVPRRLP